MAVLRSSGISILVSYIIFSILSVTAVVLRFVSIRIRQRNIRDHDYLCVLSLVCSLAYTVDTFIGTVDGGIGEHIATVPQNEVVISLKTFWVSEFFWDTSICAFRISILLLYIEIFNRKPFKTVAYFCIGVVSLFWVGSIITSFADCRPIAYNWDKTVANGYCGNLAAAEVAVAAINMVLDAAIVSLPVPIVWGLQMPLQKKLAVISTFGLGLSISGINLGRIIKVVDCSLTDFTYCTRDSAILTVAEMAVGVIVACVPTLGAVLFPARFSPSQQIKAEARRQLDDADSHGKLWTIHRTRKAAASQEDDDFATPSGDNERDIALTDQVFAGGARYSSFARATGGSADDSHASDMASNQDYVQVRRDIEVSAGSQPPETR